MSRLIRLGVRLVLGVLVISGLAARPTTIYAQSGSSSSDIKLEGFIESPAGLTLPLPPGAPPVTVIVSFGLPALQIPVVITPATLVEVDEGLPPATIGTGDRVKIEVRFVGAVIEATRVRIEDFPEFELRGTAQGVPAGGVSVPLTPGATLDFTLLFAASGVAVPVRLTGAARLEGVPFVLQSGTLLEIETVVRDFLIVITKIHREDD